MSAPGSLRAELVKLVEQWRADSERWREDEDTPYACEWADTIDECAKDIDALLVEWDEEKVG